MRRTTLPEHENRTVARYFLAPPLAGAIDGRPVSVIDLSPKGARLELTGALAPGTSIQLQIETDAGGFDAEATLLWCQIDELRLDGSDDRYLAGIVFREWRPEIESLISDLTESGAAVLIEDFRSEDRYTITAPLTGGFGDIAPVSVIDISLHGARMLVRSRLATGTDGVLRFQVDEQTGPTDVPGTVMWCAPAQDESGFVAGLKIDGAEAELRTAIHRLCVRGEARIDVLSLRRKFDALRRRPAAPLAHAKTA
jgi:hypothetical protein